MPFLSSNPPNDVSRSATTGDSLMYCPRQRDRETADSCPTQRDMERADSCPTQRDMERANRLVHLFIDKEFVGAVDELVDIDDLVPDTLAAVVLNNLTEDHDGLYEQLSVLGLRHLVQHGLHTQRKLDLARRHLDIHSIAVLSRSTNQRLAMNNKRTLHIF